MKLNKKLLSIQIRDISLQYDSYTLKIQPQNMSLIDVSQTQPTIFPMFPITKSMSHLYPYFYFDSNYHLLIYLVSKSQNKAKHSFPIYMPDVEFIGNDLSTMKIKKYPIILLEFLNGFYTATEYIENIMFDNTSINELKGISDCVLLNQNQRKLFAPKDLVITTLRDQKLRYQKTSQELEVINAQYNKKNNEFLLLLKQYLAIIQAEQKFNNLNEISKKRRTAEELMKTKNSLIIQSSSNIRTLNKYLNVKVKDIEKKIQVYKNEIDIKREKVPPLLLQIASTQKINKMYIKKFLSEYSFVFFNQRLCKYITYPHFYKEDFSERNKIKRQTYFENNEKKISLFFGFIAQMVTFLSKALNIPMRYPLFVHGASSSLVKGVNTYIKLYSFTLNTNFERGFECIKDMISVLLSYLLNKDLLTSEWAMEKGLMEILKKKLNDFGDNNRLKDNIFILFLLYDQYFNTFISDNQHFDNAISFEKQLSFKKK